MPKRQRTTEEKLEYYKKKLKKYGKQQDVCEPITGSPSGYTPQSDRYESDDNEIVVEPDIESDTSELSQDFPTAAPQTASPSEVLPPPAEAEESSTTPQNQTQSSPDTQETSVPSLDPELIQALGEATDSTPDFGEKIHENLSQLKGKEKLTKEYLIPENCKLLQAPKLNAEIKAAINDLSRSRDKKIVYSQQQLGAGITAINRAMTVLLTTEDKVKAIKCLSDGCRILCDLHFMQSQLRKKIITSSLDKSFCQVIQDVERDETLFGDKLLENIKASKAIDRQSSQIKKLTNNPKPSTSQTSAGRSNSSSGNWTGHSRSTRQVGRGGARRGGHASHSTQRASQATAHTPLPSTSKPRAPQQQRR